MNKKYLSSFFKLMAILCLIGGSCPCSATDFDTKMFSASNIKVDVSAKNAAQAREQALKEGQQKALMVVMERITPDYVIEQLPELVPDDIIDFVQDMSVSNEKTSTVRYIATIEVRFNPELVRELLKQNGLPYVRTSGKPLLIIPVYKTSVSSPALLWEEQNVWLRAWQNRKKESFMVPLSVPSGDATDVEALDVSQVLQGHLEAVENLSQRYETEGVLVVEMIRNRNTFTINGSAMDELTATEIEPFSFTVPLRNSASETFDKAVLEVVDYLENLWKNEQMVQFNEAASLIAMAPIKDLTQWELIQKRLNRIPLISEYYLQAARAGVVQLTLFFAEDIHRLQREMNKRRLSLSVLPSGIFKLEILDHIAYYPIKGLPESQEEHNSSQSDAENQEETYQNQEEDSFEAQVGQEQEIFSQQEPSSEQGNSLEGVPASTQSQYPQQSPFSRPSEYPQSSPFSRPSEYPQSSPFSRPSEYPQQSPFSTQSF